MVRRVVARAAVRCEQCVAGAVAAMAESATVGRRGRVGRAEQELIVGIAATQVMRGRDVMLRVQVMVMRLGVVEEDLVLHHRDAGQGAWRGRMGAAGPRRHGKARKKNGVSREVRK